MCMSKVVENGSLYWFKEKEHREILDKEKDRLNFKLLVLEIFAGAVVLNVLAMFLSSPLLMILSLLTFAVDFPLFSRIEKKENAVDEIVSLIEECEHNICEYEANLIHVKGLLKEKENERVRGNPFIDISVKKEKDCHNKQR